MIMLDAQGQINAYLFQSHAILNQQSYPRVEVSDIFLEYEVLLRLGRDLGLQLSEYLLGCQLSVNVRAVVPLERTSG